jgi:hypothetical protein
VDSIAYVVAFGPKPARQLVEELFLVGFLSEESEDICPAEEVTGQAGCRILAGNKPASLDIT